MDEIQERIASLELRALARYGFVLAGWQSLQIHGLVDRPSATPNLTAMVGPVSDSATRDLETGGLDIDSGWSIGYSRGLPSLFMGPMWQKSIT